MREGQDKPLSVWHFLLRLLLVFLICAVLSAGIWFAPGVGDYLVSVKGSAAERSYGVGLTLCGPFAPGMDHYARTRSLGLVMQPGSLAICALCMIMVGIGIKRTANAWARAIAYAGVVFWVVTGFAYSVFGLVILD